MTTTFKKKQIGLAVSCVLALGLASGIARAQTTYGDKAHLDDQRRNVVKSNFGLCWHTGTGPAAVSTPECDPNYVAPPVARAVEAAPPPASPPAPVVAAAPTPASKPVAARVTLGTDTLFDFDKAEMRPAGRVALDDFVTKIRGIDLEMIMAVGHADRLGSDAYNQDLSERRATAVGSYLLSKGIAVNRVQTEGKGETQPVTRADECKGAKSTKVIACLQPDRRVEIEVVGNTIVSK